MTKKDQVYELFGQGQTPKSRAVQAVGLTKETLGKYYGGWKKLQLGETPIPAPVATMEAPEKAPEKVQLDSLPTAAFFELNGERYRIGEKTPECIVCYRLRFFDTGPLDIDKMWQVDKTVSLATFTMVRPINK